VTLIGNLDCSGAPYNTAPALWIGADGVTLNLNGFAVTAGAGQDVIENYAEGAPGGHGTTAGTPANGTTIKNGTLNLSGDGAGVDNGNGGSNLTVDVVSINGDGTNVQSVGVYDGASAGLSVIDGSISGVKNGVDLDGSIGALVKGNTIMPAYNTGFGCAGVREDSGTINYVVGNAFSQYAPADHPQTCYGLWTQYSAGTVFNLNKVTGMDVGVKSRTTNAGLTITENVMDGNNFGVYLDGQNSGDVIAGNFIKNSDQSGIADFGSFNNTYNGNILTSNGSAGSYASYFIDPAGYGPVTMVNNYARLGYDAGFSICAAYSASVSGPPYSSFVGNNAIANGTDGAAGFIDGLCQEEDLDSLASVGATWSANNAYGNASDGFVFVAPWREIVTGNTSKLNGDDGFLFYDVVADAQPLAVTNNSATYNGGYGFTGADDSTPGELFYYGPDAYPVAGSGNTGSGTNGIGDCYLVAGCS